MNRLKVGVDLGGSSVRVGFVRAPLPAGRVALACVEFHRMSVGRGSDCGVVVRRAARRILERTAALEARGWRVDRRPGIGAPGAYRQDGSVHPGTVPNLPGLERGKLHRLFQRHLGPAWRVPPRSVNNDGVVQGLLMADRYAAGSGLRRGTVVAIIPGTGLGAGVYRILDGKASAVPGPQQLFDVVVRPAEPGECAVLAGSAGPVGAKARGGEPLIAEGLLTGMSLRLRASRLLGRPVRGETLSRLALAGRAGGPHTAFGPHPRHGRNRNPAGRAGGPHTAFGPHPRHGRNRNPAGRGPGAAAAARLFEQVGRDLGRFIALVHRGRLEKRAVPFAPATKGAAVFLLGGRWMLEGAGLAISLPAARRELRSQGLAAIRLVTLAEIPGLAGASEVMGVLGASLL
ncbi:MAG: ROK family protein [Elusimicrobia bacterium]|nr:ROK family protein [Elusimicrobiota bacterium]